MKTIIILLMHCLLFIPNVKAQDTITHDKRTLFKAVKYINDDPYIMVDNEWVKIHSIAGREVSEYIQLAAEYHPLKWEKAFHRWLHYLFDDLEIARNNYIDVSYYKEEKVITKPFKLEIENRDLATAFHDSIYKIRHLERDPSGNIPPSYTYLTQRIFNDSIDNNYWISKAEAVADLNYLEYELIENYSYLKLKKYDFHLGLDAIRNALGRGIDKRDFAIQLKLFLANFGDGHTRVSFRDLGKFKNLPFRIVKHDGIFYAINAMTNAFYMNEYPEVKSIEGIDVDVLFETAMKLSSKTTDGFVESISLSYMRYVELILKLQSVSVGNEVEVEFYNSDLNLSQKKEILLGDFKLPSLNLEHILYDSILTNQIGYLAFNYKMKSDNDFIKKLHEAMFKLNETKSLIIDIRGNGGGSRDALVNLMPYFINEPIVLNVARYRIDYNPNLRPLNGFLEKRFLYPMSAEDEILNGRSASFKKCINEFIKTFQPNIKVSDTLFSDYHYMVAFPEERKGIKYAKPVIVLVDENCFSASDIFAAGIKQAPNVILVGNVTGGGSGYSDRKHLPFSDISFKLSRMFSYQPNGQNYDGVGVKPDIQIHKTLLDKMGKTDSQLDYAIRYLERNLNNNK